LVATCVATNMKKGARGGNMVSPTLRRAGLKIRWGSRPVWVRLPPSALALFALATVGRPSTATGRASTVPARRPRQNGQDATVKVGVLTGGGDCPGLNA